MSAPGAIADHLHSGGLELRRVRRLRHDSQERDGKVAGHLYDLVHTLAPWEGKVMRTGEDTRKCVLFLGWQEPGPVDEAPIDPKGTGFLISGDPGRGGGLYLVTAKHVAERLDPPFVIRVNKKGGGAGLVHIERPEDIHWCFHPTDETVDIAIAPVHLPSWADMTAINGASLFSTAPKEWADIDAGDNAFVIGLFHLHHGERRNVPVVFRGSVALLPSDELILVDGKQVEGYLVQTNAISRFSGSPVFATRTISLRAKEPLVGASCTENRRGPKRYSIGLTKASQILVPTGQTRADIGGAGRLPQEVPILELSGCPEWS